MNEKVRDSACIAERKTINLKEMLRVQGVRNVYKFGRIAIRILACLRVLNFVRNASNALLMGCSFVKNSILFITECDLLYQIF